MSSPLERRGKPSVRTIDPDRPADPQPTPSAPRTAAGRELVDDEMGTRFLMAGGAAAGFNEDEFIRMVLAIEAEAAADADRSAGAERRTCGCPTGPNGIWEPHTIERADPPADAAALDALRAEVEAVCNAYGDKGWAKSDMVRRLRKALASSASPEASDAS